MQPSRCAECGDVLSDALVLLCGHDLCLGCSSRALRETGAPNGRVVRCLLCGSVTELVEEAAAALRAAGPPELSAPRSAAKSPPQQLLSASGTSTTASGSSTPPPATRNPRFEHPRGAPLPESSRTPPPRMPPATFQMEPIAATVVPVPSQLAAAHARPHLNARPERDMRRQGSEGALRVPVVVQPVPARSAHGGSMRGSTPPRSRRQDEMSGRVDGSGMQRGGRPPGALTHVTGAGHASQQATPSGSPRSITPQRRWTATCPEHPEEPATYWCATCECACICAECVVHGAHRNHEVTKVSRASDALRSRTGALLDEALALEEDMAVSADRLAWRRKEVERAAARGRASVRSAFARVRAQLADRETELLESLDGYESQSFLRLDDGTVDQEARLAELRRLQESLRARCRGSDAAEALNTYAAARRTIAALQEAFRCDEREASVAPGHELADQAGQIAGSARGELELHAEGLASLEAAVADICRGSPGHGPSHGPTRDPGSVAGNRAGGGRSARGAWLPTDGSYALA